MRKDIMVDIETLGTKEGASIIQIAAMSFDINTGEVYDEINLIGDISTYMELSADGDTIKWWLNNNGDLLKELLNKGTLNEHEMLESLYNWIVQQAGIKDVYLWGNGILFDNAKLQKSMNATGNINYPIFYRNDRDVRTIVELASLKSGKSESELKELCTNDYEVKHDAFDDIKFQIRLVQLCYEILIKDDSLF